MASIIKVDTIQDQDGNNIINESANTITIGASGDTITIPSGATLANSGIVTGFQSTGIDDNATSTAITINSSQQVGIGTASPTSKLQVEGSTTINSTGTPPLTIHHTDGNTVALAFQNDASDNHSLMFTDGDFRINYDGSEKMRINSSGNVGINTSSPSVKLDVRATSFTPYNTNTTLITEAPAVFSQSQHFYIYNAGAYNNSRPTGGIGAVNASSVISLSAGSICTDNPGANGFRATATNSSLYDIGNGEHNFKTKTGLTVGDQFTHTTRMIIQDSGNVGIGTTSPSSTLHISGDPQVTLTQPNNLVLQNDTDSATSGDAKTGILFRANYSGTTPTDLANITAGKQNTVNGNYDAFIGFCTRTYGVNQLQERMRIDAIGNVGINTTSPESGSLQTISHPGSSKYGLNLDSSNTSGTQYHLQFKRGGTQAGYITSNTATTIAVNNASDERLKENIQNSNSAIEDLKNMQVRQFDWKDGIDTHRDFGFVAQELINVVPEAVTQGTDELDDNGKPVRSWGVDYSHIVPRLVKVCQEQQTKIEDLEARITALETQP